MDDAIRAKLAKLEQQNASELFKLFTEHTPPLTNVGLAVINVLLSRHPERW
jgi:hypothetical protein